ncbi:MAG: zinc ribbon domain-containing protein [Syntrophales bacterium]|nr:zinc ribbon domain-containing protein [Syntrophales bacterium]
MENDDLVKCSNCGETMGPEATFCARCGGRLEKRPPVKKCASCGRTMEPQAVFCSRCGKRYEGVAAVAGGGAVRKMIWPSLILILIIVLAVMIKLFSSGIPPKTISSENTGDKGGKETMTRELAEEKPPVAKRVLIETDGDVYRRGEVIRVRYYDAPGYSRDWICIVPAGSRSTEAGDYQYIPKRGRGVMTFRVHSPGRYEVRAFYHYSPGVYRVTARHTFTVRE